jgi:ATP-dependent exoDNAse (exonuclease V) beta subunit
VVDGAARESLRLLYVGFTRARDHLILAARASKKEAKPPKHTGKTAEAEDAQAPPTMEVTLYAQWLDTIHDGKAALLNLPSSDEVLQSVAIRGAKGPKGSAAARVWWLSGGAQESAVVPAARCRWYALAVPAPATSYRIAPSRAAEDWPAVASGSPIPSIRLHLVGPRLPFALGDEAMNEVGNAIHAFFAADSFDRSAGERRIVAERILRARGFLAVAQPDDLVAAHDRLRQFLAALYPGAVWHREVPVAGKVNSPAGLRQVNGSIDLLLETREGWVVVDHKTYPGTDWETRARAHALQLAAYRRVLDSEGTKQVLAQFVHFPIGGRIAELLAGSPQ